MPGYKWKCRFCNNQWSTLVAAENRCPLCGQWGAKYYGKEYHDLRTGGAPRSVMDDIDERPKSHPSEHPPAGGFISNKRARKKRKGGRKYP